MQTLDNFLGRLGRWLAWAAVACLVLMMVEVCLDVAGRFLLSMPMPSTLEIVSEWWMPALIFLPLLNVEWRDENIAVDILHQRLNPRWRAACDAFALLCFGLFLWLIAYAGFEQAMRAARQGEFIVGMIPVITWPPRFFLPVAGCLTGLLCLVRAVGAIRVAVTGRGGYLPNTLDSKGAHLG
ncbi:TRAP transporter small permease subunit [Stappia indica]|uniref:TRAP transporter small permease subunit n=1 Tax=Stappia indica TaxID=538381 RepID=UPI001CD7E21C|nr:TRAP transporter small permease [Stappia indica]MCA1296813.1 TRAP transporter small permease [Stappia indica]